MLRRSRLLSPSPFFLSLLLTHLSTKENYWPKSSRPATSACFDPPFSFFLFFFFSFFPFDQLPRTVAQLRFHRHAAELDGRDRARRARFPPPFPPPFSSPLSFRRDERDRIAYRLDSRASAFLFSSSFFFSPLVLNTLTAAN